MHTTKTLRDALIDAGDTLPVLANGYKIKSVQLTETPIRHIELVLDTDPAVSAPPADQSER